jgi:ubiquinone/menaquinone biosynthesis C-methylase UbiE
MIAYEALAAAYDGLTTDVNYAAVFQFFREVLQKKAIEPETVLDLACGTGSMSVLLAQHGYRVLGVDLSEEMLTVAAQKAAALSENPPYFIRQPMERLRLPYEVDAVCCFLDSLNYVTKPEACRQTFQRVFRALKAGGIFFFDINTPHKFRGMDGQVFLDENDDSYCVWRVEFEETTRLCYYGIDLFRRRGDLWERSAEQHCEYAYEPAELVQWLREAGFACVELYGDCTMDAPTADAQRIYFAAYKE